MGLNICLIRNLGEYKDDHPEWDCINPPGRKDDCIITLIDFLGNNRLEHTSVGHEFFRFPYIEKTEVIIDLMDIDDEQKARFKLLVQLQARDKDYWIWLS